ncbi:ABC transporter substrate-binding protein [Microbacterium caowuchunii]|uniref:Thiamine pyrimidine synthase n=1 Tax=Microbacterium caowuchunii TaxID=2614638 RepID=A0A5N0TEU5_9MICO|nr:ABC transporter substrate-binding protein [Microbacterium caowuchunii]KAA9133653.1 ABC transporter substrate-binding protein [Microbacterium caowuchunii]
MVFRPFHSRAARTAVAAAGIAAVLATAGCASSSDTASAEGEALVELTLQTSWIPLVQFGGSYIADAEGYYNEHGVDVDILPGGPDVDPMAAVAAGQADIGMANADNVARANEQGADLVIIAAGFQKNPLAILSSPENPIETPADMEGKKIGVPAGDEAAQQALEAVNNLDADAITTVPVSFDVAPLVSGEVDGMWVFYTEQPISYEENTGIDGTTMLTADYGYEVYAQVYVVTRETLEDETKRPAIEGFLAAEIKGWEAYVADPALAVELTVEDYAKDGGLTVENQTKQAERQLDLLVTPETEEHGLLWISADGIAKNLATLKSLGLTADKGLFDTSVLEAVSKGAGDSE